MTEGAKSLNEIVEILQAPTPPKEIKFLGFGPKNGKAVAIPYVDMVFVAGRLDEACGPFGWQSDIRLDASGEIAVGLGIRDPDYNEWLWRWDVGSEGKKADHGSKEEVTAAIKRAASQWGIARDLREIPKLRVACNSYEGKDKKQKWSSWKENPNDVIAKFIEGKNGNNGHHRGAETGADPQDEGKSDEKPTVEEARAHVIRLLMSDAIGYTSQQASKYIMDQDNGLEGKRPTVQHYRDMYKRLQASNVPPD
jgi:hypothetical protein